MFWFLNVNSSHGIAMASCCPCFFLRTGPLAVRRKTCHPAILPSCHPAFGWQDGRMAGWQVFLRTATVVALRSNPSDWLALLRSTAVRSQPVRRRATGGGLTPARGVARSAAKETTGVLKIYFLFYKQIKRKII